MTIAIDISQVCYEGTGVARYIQFLIPALLRIRTPHTFILFGSSLRQRTKLEQFVQPLCMQYPHVRSVLLPVPPSVLEFIWNTLHIVPIEWILGDIDIFWSSDWTQPPVKKALAVTTIHDISVLRNPETFSRTIRDVHMKKLERSKKVCRAFFCDSESTKKDVQQQLHIPEHQLYVVYPGLHQGVTV